MADNKKSTAAVHVKYMGTSDVRRIEKGDTFGGRFLGEASVPKTVEWNWDNYHVVDVSEAGWSSDLVDALCGEQFSFGDHTGPEFERVDISQPVKPNMAQVLFRGARPNKKLAHDEKLAGPDTAITDAANNQAQGKSARPSGTTSENTGTDAPARST